MPKVLLGIGLMIAAFLIGYFVALISQIRRGRGTLIKFLTADAISGLATAASLATLLPISNFINSFAEPGLFADVLIPLFLRQFDARLKSFVSAFLVSAR